MSTRYVFSKLKFPNILLFDIWWLACVKVGGNGSKAFVKGQSVFLCNKIHQNGNIAGPGYVIIVAYPDWLFVHRLGKNI